MDPPRTATAREKWLADCEFKNRQLSLAERTHELAVREHELKLRDLTQSNWKSPLVVAILAATVAALGNALVTYTNGRMTRELQADKSEQARILEMIKTGDPDSAADNLRFLLDAGLITNVSIVDQIRQYLRTRKRGTGTALPVAFGGIVGQDDAKAIDSTTTPAVRVASGSVGKISVAFKDSGVSQCTGFLIAEGLVATAGHCVEYKDHEIASVEFAILDSRYKVSLPPVAIKSGSSADVDGDFAVLRVSGNPGTKHGIISLAPNRPKPGESLTVVYFRFGKQLFVSEVEECKVFSVGKNTLIHGCDTGPGTSGAPLLSSDGMRAVGLHSGLYNANHVGTRASTILNAIDANKASSAQ